MLASAKSKRITASLLALIIIAIAVYGFLTDTEPQEQTETQLRIPTGKQLLEPDRPDLIGDPGIANEDNEEGEIPDD